MTMKKLAELAGVSVSTISKAFSHSSEISEEKREHIFRVAKEAGCYDKYCKRIFDKPVIAVICPEFESGYYSQQLFYFEREIKKQGGIMIVSSVNFDNQSKNEMMSYFTEIVKVDGIIVYNHIKNSAKYSVPVVVIGESEDYDSVCLSNEKSMDDSIKCFLKAGKKNIAFVGERLTRTKKRDYIKAMEKNGCHVNDEYIVESNGRFQVAGYESMNHLFELDVQPDAVVCAYDEIAIGVMKSIYEHEKKIPEDIAVIGMDDIRTNPYLDTSLSSITSYNEDFCQIVTDILFENIKNPSRNKHRKVNISSELIKRASLN